MSIGVRFAIARRGLAPSSLLSEGSRSARELSPAYFESSLFDGLNAHPQLLELEDLPMEVVLIDKFAFPEESKAKLMEAARRSSEIIRNLPGFVEAYVYESADTERKPSLVTVAVWKDETSFENARKLVAESYKRIGFDPQSTMHSLNVTIERGVYRRSPY